MTMPIRLALGQGIGLGIRTKLHDPTHPSSARARDRARD